MMIDVALRPLTLGEILDRTFSLYRRHFLLFLGIVAIPEILVLALGLADVISTGETTQTLAAQIGWGLSTWLLSLIVYVFAQGGATVAVSEIYLGRTITMGEALSRVMKDFWRVLGMITLSGLAIGAGMILLIFPGIYLACRFMVGLPAAVIEHRGPTQALSRSMALTKGFAGRAFLIFLLAIVLAIAALLFCSAPFTYLIYASASDPARQQFWKELNQIGTTLGTVIVTPITLIATSVFYYDLRVRKEAFDLQFMMNSDSAPLP